MEENFINSLADLTGRVAIVTGGAAGIGLETTIYLAQKGATVYVASRNPEKSEAGIATARERLGGKGGEIKFHQLQLSDVKSASASAKAFLEIEKRLDIVVCNAGISMATLKDLSPDGYENMFATNHLGHYAFVNGLLGLLEQTAAVHGEARIVVVSSNAHKQSSKINYNTLTTRVEKDGDSIKSLKGAFERYGTSKLANIYYASELDQRLRAKGIKNVYCNSCHPGMVTSTGLGTGHQTSIGPGVEKVLRSAMNVVSNSLKDTAKTQTFLAASPEIVSKDIHGEYWVPSWTWNRKFQSCHKESLGALAVDSEEQKKLWDVSSEVLSRGDNPSQP